jgi:GMP synthase (glutamine-hydrolysing)
MTHTTRPKLLLLQIRNADDPMRGQEIRCFARALNCEEGQISVFDLLTGAPSMELLSEFDVVLLGGSGDYSVAEGGIWLPPALEAMRELYQLGKPTFASCWGFQAMSKALGGEVVTDLDRAEVGTHTVRLTEAGRVDPLFAGLGNEFLAPMGHEDCVVRLPDEAILLASTDRVQNQAFRIRGKPIYCTQFHPELNRADLLERVRAYPQYIRSTTGKSIETFEQNCREPVACNQLLHRFMQQFVLCSV